MQLIKITEQNGSQVVSARELHVFLENTDNVSTWFKRQSERAMLIENEDFTRVAILQTSGQNSFDYAISLSSAKEIAMLNGGEKGKEARKYFIECEKQAKQPQKLSTKELLTIALQEIAEEKQQLLLVIEKQAPKVLFADAVATSNSCILVGELAKILKQNGIDIGQNRLFEQLRIYGYLISRKGTDYNMPTQKSMNLQLFQIKETVINHSDGHISISKTAKISGRGQNYFINKFLKIN